MHTGLIARLTRKPPKSLLLNGKRLRGHLTKEKRNDHPSKKIYKKTQTSLGIRKI